MCGIIGYKHSGDDRLKAGEFIKELLLQSAIRGCHATGYTTITEDSEELVTLREAIPAKDFVRDYPDIFEELSEVGLFHCRYATSGAGVTRENSQPLQTSTLAIAHNGIVSQATPAEYSAQYNVSPSTDNDSEILLATIAACYEGNNLAGAVEHGVELVAQVASPVYALVALDHLGHLVGSRDAIRPLWYFHVPELELQGFCSTRDIFERAARNLKGETLCHQLTPSEVMAA